MTAPSSGRRSLAARLRRLFASAEQREAEDLEERARAAGAEPIGDAAERSKVRFRGTVTAITAAPGTGWLEAELTDGSGTVTLVWMGRRRLEAVLPGSNLVVTGRLARDGERCVIYNPDYEVVS